MSEDKATYTAGVPKTLEVLGSRACCLVKSNQNYEAPTLEEINAFFAVTGWSQRETAVLSGVPYTEKGSSLVRRWRNGQEEIPYSVWRLLLNYSGVVSDTPVRADQVLNGGL